MLKVKQIFDDSEQRYGADKIRAVLAENGLRISTKRVLPIMQELGLHSIRTDAKKVYKNQMRKKQNLLHRKFTTDHPNQVWVSDITYFKIKCMGLSLRYYRPLLPQSRRVSSIPCNQYSSRHNHFSQRL